MYYTLSFLAGRRWCGIVSCRLPAARRGCLRPFHSASIFRANSKSLFSCSINFSILICSSNIFFTSQLSNGLDKFFTAKLTLLSFNDWEISIGLHFVLFLLLSLLKYGFRSDDTFLCLILAFFGVVSLSYFVILPIDLVRLKLVLTFKTETPLDWSISLFLFEVLFPTVDTAARLETFLSRDFKLVSYLAGIFCEKLIQYS